MRIYDFLSKYKEKQAVSFHMPGHKGSGIYVENGFQSFFDGFMDMDITEIEGADNLFQAEGCILEAMEAYRRLYNTKKSYLLVNGSSSGIIAAMLASVPKGGKLIMARNCHKSVYNGLALGGITPVYVYPELSEGSYISGPVPAAEVAKAIEANPDAKAVILPSPNYYGICSDIKAIAKLAHDHGMVLIVDQAHGAHLKFFEDIGAGFPVSGEGGGADLVINSTHKTLASFTQTAVLNLCSDRVEPVVIEEKLQQIESSSPSYILMASLDINARILESRAESYMRRWKENLHWFYDQAAGISGLKVLRPEDFEGNCLDISKINLVFSALGIDGGNLEKLLIERNIYPELTAGSLVMCMTGIGNTREDYERLIEALREISRLHAGASPLNMVKNGYFEAMESLSREGKPVVIPAEKEPVDIRDAAGRVSAVSIIPYPPGIPLICPGEVITAEVAAYAAELKTSGQKVMGVDDRLQVVCGRR